MFKKKKETKTPVERYLAQLDRMFQKGPQFYPVESSDPALSSVTNIVYSGIPEKNMTTALTYGLSLAEHPDWKQGRLELILTVESTDDAWKTVAGYVAERLRGNCPFSYSNTINFGEKIADDSDMDAFLVFAPGILERKDFLDIDVGCDYHLNLVGLYPIYASEMKLIDEWGLKKFWHHPDWDLFSVRRSPIEG